MRSILFNLVSPPFLHVLTYMREYRYANVGIDQSCTSEVISHEYKTHDGEHYVNLIAWDNCLTASLFCSNDTATCQPVRMVGDTCRFHRDCQSVSFLVPISKLLCVRMIVRGSILIVCCAVSVFAGLVSDPSGRALYDGRVAVCCHRYFDHRRQVSRLCQLCG